MEPTLLGAGRAIGVQVPGGVFRYQALMSPLGDFLPEPELIPPCPRCGDRDLVQLVVVVFPAYMPTAAHEAHRVRFYGCLIQDDSLPEPWWCPTCECGYPFTYPFNRTLLVKEPWVGLLLDGLKTWELRRTSTSVRGPVGLTPSGSGEIAGCAELVDVRGPFTAEELRSHWSQHMVDDEFLDEYAAGKPLYAWEFTKARRYDWPLDYEHPQGAVIWVKLPRSRLVTCTSCGQDYPASAPFHADCGRSPNPS